MPDIPPAFVPFVALAVIFGTLALIFGTLVVAAWQDHLRRLEQHRRRHGHECAKCGYDLRASGAATPGRCPECGAVPAETSASA